MKEQLIGELKLIVFRLMYAPRSGRLGMTSASTMYQVFTTVRSMADFCARKSENRFSQVISLFDLLSNASYLAAYLNHIGVRSGHIERTGDLLNKLNSIGRDQLGFDVCSKSHFDFEVLEYKQHPVIPSSIYLEIMMRLDELVDAVYPLRDNIKALILEMGNRRCGHGIGAQKGFYYKIPVNERPCKMELFPTMEELLNEYGLNDLMMNTFMSVGPHRKQFGKFIRQILYVLKHSLHFYTGMRDQEGARVPYSCVQKHEIDAALLDDKGDIIDSSRMINLVSSTTKYSGYQRTDTWLAPDRVIKTIVVAQSICEGLSQLYGKNLDEVPLFLSPHIIHQKDAEMKAESALNAGKKGFLELIAQGRFKIKAEDLAELSNTDPDRDFSVEEKFNVGNTWPLSSHQFRRSLAFYASNSEFVTSPTITSQFKQLSKLMAQYYSRGNERFLSIFSNTQDHRRQAESHVAYDYQMAVPINAVKMLLQDVLDNDGVTLGGTGSYLEKQKKRIGNGEITIFEMREETLKMAAVGEISHRITLLGGCTKVGPCDDQLMGDFTACLSCGDAVVNRDEVQSMLSSSIDELKGYAADSAEYQLLSSEISKLRAFIEKNSIAVTEIA